MQKTAVAKTVDSKFPDNIVQYEIMNLYKRGRNLDGETINQSVKAGFRLHTEAHILENDRMSKIRPTAGLHKDWLTITINTVWYNIATISLSMLNDGACVLQKRCRTHYKV